MPAVAARIEAVRRSVADAADAAGRDPGDIRIVAVTKTVGIEHIRHAANAGMQDFGENRVQEFLGKYGLFPAPIRWHFIGSLQSNKVKDVVGRAFLIHSIDSEKLLAEVHKRAEEAGVVQDVLLQVNISSEASKHGFVPDEVHDALVAASELSAVRVKGLMTMAPFERPESVRWVFRDLRELRDSLREIPLNGVELDELSMGMTSDYRVAVEEGSTIVRIGRAIFGR